MSLKIGQTNIGLVVKSEGIIPSGTLSITANGEYDVTNYSAANVNVVNEYNTKINVTFQAGKHYVSQNITELPATLDFSNQDSASAAFLNFSNLTTCPSLINTNSISRTDNMFASCSKLTTVPLFDTSNVTNMKQMFNGCSELTTIPLFNTAKVTNMNSMFNGCSALTSVPLIDTSKATDLSMMFAWNSHLVTVPIFNIESAISATCVASMFYGCTALSNDSLNNILAMCIGATSYTGTKTLEFIGLTSTQATTCTGLSNWTAAQNAGWATGY